MIYMKKFALPEGKNGEKRRQAEHQAGLELLEAGLKREYGLSFPDLTKEIAQQDRGKPYLIRYPQICFNISHSRDMAVCGLSRERIGVDVEEIRPVRLTSTKRMLTKGEARYLEGCSDEIRNREFFRLWTLKESYAKALGMGLSLDFTQVEFSLCPLAQPCLLWKDFREEKEEYPWKFFQMIWEKRYILSCCSAEEISGKDVFFS